MSEQTDTKPPVAAFPSGGDAAIASAHAPFLYFEDAPAFGHMNGIVRITLTASRIMPRSDVAAQDQVVVAHLRMNLFAALSLKAAIESALLLAAPASSDKNN